MSALDDMKKRASFNGYEYHDNKLVSGKLRSLTQAMRNSYQAEYITYNNQTFRCLINPDKLTENYDKKILSVPFGTGIEEGSVFYWDRTESYWICSLQHLTEEAYFKASINRCNYYIDIDENRYHIYLRGPLETTLEWNQKHNISFNNLNYSMMFYITKNAETTDYFERFRKFKIDGHNYRVALVDKYTQRGIMEVYIEEYFDNEMEDAQIIPEPIVPPTPLDPFIEGEQFIYPYDTKEYTILNAENGEWLVTEAKKVRIDESDKEHCTITITSGKSFTFDLIYRRENEEDIKLTITVKSM